MRDVMTAIDRWHAEEMPVAEATVVETWGSAPRQAGAKMAMTAAGQIAGSVSGGCVEGAVYDAALEVLTGGPARLLRFGVADETAWDVGLACGGTIEVFVERLDWAFYTFTRDLLHQDEPFAVVTVTGGSERLLGKKLLVQRGGRLFGQIEPDLDGHVAAVARMALAGAETERRTFDLADLEAKPFEVFIQVYQPAPTLILVGGVHIAIALTAVARSLGYRTIVIDPRRAFGSQERFPDVERLIQAWPDDAFPQIDLTTATAVVLLTHDPKIDDPALIHVLRSPVFYVGALGSKRTHAARRERLLAAGLTAAQVNRIHGPVGLDIGARTPEEIAVAIMAEIIAARRNRG